MGVTHREPLERSTVGDILERPELKQSPRRPFTILGAMGVWRHTDLQKMDREASRSQGLGVPPHDLRGVERRGQGNPRHGHKTGIITTIIIVIITRLPICFDCDNGPDV